MSNAAKQFRAVVDFIEGPSILNAMFKGKLLESVEDVENILRMCEVHAPVDGKGYMKAYFFVTICALTDMEDTVQMRVDLNSDNTEDRIAFVAKLEGML